jgi:hypothetical protein
MKKNPAAAAAASSSARSSRASSTASTPTVAFALGGLAGNNAHGGGFLQAALDQRIEPLMISCTSGQLRWVKHYLAAREGGTSLRSIMAAEVADLHKTGNLNTDVAMLGLFGKSKVFRPAYEHLLPDLMRNASQAYAKLLHSRGNVLLADQLMSLLPGRSLVPEFELSYFDGLRDAFNTAPMGIAFNAYNPKEGVEYVYVNAKAKELLQVSTTADAKDDAKNEGAPPAADKTAGKVTSHRPYRVYRDIDTTAVRDALWLYQYGFYEKDTQFVDGAYFRDMMLAEGVVADVIFSVRPINHKWLGELPHSYQDVEDLKTEVAFNGTYAAERDQITLINKLLSKNYLDPKQGRGFHHIDLVELEVSTQRGYFDYMLESQDVFDASEKMALAKFAELRSAGQI